MGNLITTMVFFEWTPYCLACLERVKLDAGETWRGLSFAPIFEGDRLESPDFGTAACEECGARHDASGLVTRAMLEEREAEYQDAHDGCGDCQGTGIGWGGPDSNCSSCRGSGARRVKYERDPDDYYLSRYDD